jgi:hypothetical protein
MTPENDTLWISRLSGLVNVSMITVIGECDLWLEMLALQTVRIWTSQASKQLCRMEFWSTVLEVELTEEGDILQVWMDSPNQLFRRFLKMRWGFGISWV